MLVNADIHVYNIHIKNGGAHIWANTLNALRKMNLVLKNIQCKEKDLIINQQTVTKYILV